MIELMGQESKKPDVFAAVLEYLPERLRQSLNQLPLLWRGQLSEIRLRSERPIQLNGNGQNYFLSTRCRPLFTPEMDSLRCSAEEINETFRRLCEYSVYSYQRQICSGYITLRGGHRVGLCGTAIYKDGQCTGLRDISAINLRIARTVPGAADDLFRGMPQLMHNGSILIAGAPNTGKTTMLRDFARQLSAGVRCEAQRVTVVDERGELAMMFHGVSQAGEDFLCDVLDAVPKAEGIRMAVRALSPQIIVCDEVSTEEEASAILSGVHTGVRFALSVHASCRKELWRRPVIRRLLSSGAFDAVALLADGKPGQLAEIVQAGEYIAENDGAVATFSNANDMRISEIPAAV